MASRGLIQNECGGDNPLLRMATHLSHDLSHKEMAVPVTNSTYSNQSSMYNAIPMSFGMKGLYEQIENIDNQFMPNNVTKTHPPSNAVNTFSDPFQRQLHPQHIHQPPLIHPALPIPMLLQRQPEGATSLQETYQQDDLQWAHEYLENAPSIQLKSDNEDTITGDEAMLAGEQIDTPGLEHFWYNLQKQWEELAHSDIDSHPWLLQKEELDREIAYPFSDDNHFDQKDLDGKLRRGEELLKKGDLNSAILMFEAEVKENPQSARAWLLLGSSQAENEQDELAIAALRRSIQLDPTSLEARLLLAVSYSNEHKLRQGTNTLQEWLALHPEYSKLLPESFKPLPPQPPYMPSFIDPSAHKEVFDLFHKALPHASEPNSAAELYTALGVLSHMGEDYQMAAENFQAALKIQTDNPMLWNKLGAALANGGRSNEAIQSYNEALKLYPNYVRCRYNMGIASMHLNNYTESVQHFLGALKLQSQGRGPQKTAWNIWNTMRMAIAMGDLSELTTYVDNKDLEGLLQKYDSY